jgi:hypothetical protein
LVFCVTLPIRPDAADAHIQRRNSIEAIFRDADVVAYVTLDRQEKEYSQTTLCGTRYYATVIVPFKGASIEIGRQIVFGRYSGLETGKEYLIFLKYSADPEAIYQEVQAANHFPDPKPYVIDIIKCNGLVPGLLYDQESTWEVDGGAVMIDGLLPRSMPSTIHPESGGVAYWLLPQDEVFSYLRSLGGSPK